MSVSTVDLDRFRGAVNDRRARLRALLAASTGSPLDAELVALDEQLLVADEELRVQHEELDGLRLQLAERSFEQEVLASSVAVVVTDGEGRVLVTNAAATGLADQAVARPARRRSLATWFAAADRERFRDVLADALADVAPAVATTAPVEMSGLRLRRRDGVAVFVDLHVQPLRTPAGEPALRWELRTSGRRAVLQVVPEPAELVTDLLADDLATFALELGGHGTAEGVLAAVAESALGLVPGADAVALTLLHRGVPELSGATEPAAAELQARDLTTGFGPAADVGEAGPGTTVLSADLAADPRWRSGARASVDAGLRTVVCVCVALPGVSRTAVLSCYGARVAGLGEDAEHVAVLVAAHASVALSRTLSEATLRTAAQSRQRVGEAVGILVEREGLTTSAAFDRLVAASQRGNRPLREIARALVESTQPAPHP